jgi:drug/metabolite transporter (DMT)-like permease
MLILLIAVSLLWAFSFGLIKHHLGGIDPSYVATLRLISALVVFLPFFRPRGVAGKSLLKLAVIGGIQFGLVYILYLGAYPYLKAYQVALFTITTPLFVTLIEAGYARRWNGVHALAALISIAGAAVVVWSDWASGPDLATLKGFLMVQASNLCFAAGQIGWRWERRKIAKEHSDLSLIAVAYLGGLVVTALFAFSGGGPLRWSLTSDQLWTLLYLGTIATGVGFFLWNVAASRVDAGTLAVANNLKVPLGVLVSLLVFGEHANLVRLLVSFALLAAGAALCERARPRTP